jgi:preprotein translocase SecE subunit
MVAKQTTSTPQGKSPAGSKPVRSRPTTRPNVTGDVARRAQNVNVVTFFEQSWAELKKVTWPTRQETINLTVAVIGMTVFLAAFLGVIDFLLEKLVAFLIG